MRNKVLFLLVLLFASPALAVDVSTQTARALIVIQDPNNPQARIDRAQMQVLVDELNRLSQQMNAMRVAISSATSVANLNTRGTALPILADRTPTQARTAIKNALEAGNGN